MEEKQKKEHRRKARNRRAWIAITCLLIFLLSSFIGIQLNNHSSWIFDHSLEKILHYITGGSDTSDPSTGGAEDKSQTVRITDPEKIDAALRLMPQLLVPGYLPEGWEMESLEVIKDKDKSCSAHYILANDNNVITIDESSGFEIVNYLPNSSETISLNGNTFYYFFSDDAEEQAISFVVKNVFVQINAPIDKEILLKIANQMEPYENAEE